VSLRNTHELDAYAFQDGKWYGLIVFNYGLHRARRIDIEAPGLPPQRPRPVAVDPGLAHNANVHLLRLVSSGPGDTNEETVEVKIQEEHFEGMELTLAPCSMAVLEWQQ
jgi:hypothetical protein